MSATVFDTALQGRGLIEASAGTGKTYALAGLFARAVILERLRVPQILAVTYTVAATQELHERVRLRLRGAADLVAQWEPGDAAERAGDDAETALLRRLVHDALHGATAESLIALRLRLGRAAREMDLAVITTIHGFCQRVLGEHALEAGQPLLAPTLVPDNAARRSALAATLWRRVAQEPAGAEFLQRTFGDVDGLARRLRVLLAPEPLLPSPPPPRPDPRPPLQAAWDAFRASFALHGGPARAAFDAAIHRKDLHGGRYKPEHVAALWAWLDGVTRGAAPPRDWHERLDRFTRDALLGACNKGRLPPESPLCEAIEALVAARAAIAPWREADDLQRLHALRALAREQDETDKRALHACDYDDLIARVHAAVHDPDAGPRLAAALHAQFPLVLVDEFQDTDARQWAIFERLFGEGDGGLLLVGDPKQAIYRFRGGDVETYLLAREGARLAEPLRHNFRARPCVLGVVNTLFAQAHAASLLGDDIAFAPSIAGRAPECDAHLERDGRSAPALTFHVVPPRIVERKGALQTDNWDKPESTRHAARLCAAAIAELLRDARAGRALRFDASRMRPIEPRDCAVLVREHREAAAVRRALAAVGVPAVSAGRQSLFATEHAQTLLTLLLALAAPADARRLRALLATPLFGYDAGRLQALEDDGDALRGWQHEVMQWRLRWEQHGPQPMLADVVARQAAFLLDLADGERTLTCLLQLGELLQEARMRTLGPQGQVDWLRAAIAHADADDETQWPRLESDAGRVQILTLHASKGLEFPLVFLPFVGIGRSGSGRDDVVTYHDDARRRVRRWKTDWAGDMSWDEASRRAQAEERAEDMRLLYVGLTRARDALWVCGGALASNATSALHALLGGNAPGVELQAALDGQLTLLQGLPADAERLPAQPALPVPPARTPSRTLRRDWWIHSFSQLHRQRPHGTLPADEAPADDERPPAVPDVAAVRFGGARFGNALHQALEHCDFARWRDADGSRIPDGQGDVLVQALRDQDYPADSLADGLRELAPLVARTLNAPLPCDATAPRLCDVPTTARVAELEFHFTLADTDTHALLALLHRHDIVRERRDFGAWPRLSGLMTGKIDLTCRLDGRAWVLDYKSNRLPDYQDATLAQAMATSEYDLQALLYVVALHRWMRVRLGDGYDIARDIGGAHYLFCRGLDPTQPGRGIATRRFADALVLGVDALFAAGAHA